MKTIAISRADGGVSIMQIKHRVVVTPVDEDGVTMDVVERDIAAEITKWETAMGGVKCAAWAEIDPAALPTDRTFRNAWKVAGKSVVHDMAKVREIAHDMRRKARAAEMAPHDEAIARQIPGVDAKETEGKRQAIRDKYAAIQEAIDGAPDVAGVRAALPHLRPKLANSR